MKVFLKRDLEIQTFLFYSSAILFLLSIPTLGAALYLYAYALSALCIWQIISGVVIYIYDSDFKRLRYVLFFIIYILLMFLAWELIIGFGLLFFLLVVGIVPAIIAFDYLEFSKKKFKISQIEGPIIGKENILDDEIVLEIKAKS